MNMNEKEEKNRNISSLIDEGLDKDIARIASARGVEKNQVIREAIRNMTGKDQPTKQNQYKNMLEMSKDLPNTGNNGGLPSIQEIILLKMMGGIDKDTSKDSGGFDMEKAMSYQLLKSMFTPNPMEMMMTMNMMGKGNEKSDDSANVYREMMAGQQQQQATLMAAVFGKNNQDSSNKINEIERKNTENQMQAKLDFAQNVLPILQKLEHKMEQLEKGGGERSSIVEEMKEYQEFNTAMKEYAKSQGLSEGSGGKQNWSELIQQVLGFGKEAVSKLPKSPPPQQRQMKPVNPKIIPKPINTTKPVIPTQTTTKPNMPTAKTTKPAIPTPTTNRPTMPQPTNTAKQGKSFTEPMMSGDSKKSKK